MHEQPNPLLKTACETIEGLQGKNLIGYVLTRTKETRLAIQVCLSVGDERRGRRTPARSKPATPLWGFIYINKPDKDPCFVRTTRESSLAAAMAAPDRDVGVFTDLETAVRIWTNPHTYASHICGRCGSISDRRTGRGHTCSYCGHAPKPYKKEGAPTHE